MSEEFFTKKERYGKICNLLNNYRFEGHDTLYKRLEEEQSQLQSWAKELSEVKIYEGVYDHMKFNSPDANEYDDAAGRYVDEQLRRICVNYAVNAIMSNEYTPFENTYEIPWTETLSKRTIVIDLY